MCQISVNLFAVLVQRKLVGTCKPPVIFKLQIPYKQKVYNTIQKHSIICFKSFMEHATNRTVASLRFKVKKL